jgi:hypothetical protein
MRQRRDPMANVVRRTWTEPIDDNAFAAIAEFTETWHGMYFAASTFVLLERRHRNWQWREQVEEKLADELRRCVHSIRFGGFNRHGMPMVGRVKDLNRA